LSWWVVVNPWSGRSGEVESRARAALEKAAVDHDLRVSSSEEHLADLVGEGRRSGATRFAAVGGDGTANLVLNAMLREPWQERPTLAILPAGSGSDFIRTFALPRSLDVAATHLTTDDVYPCDVGRIEGGFGTRYFLNAANAGVTAASVKVGRHLPRRIGGLRYTLGFWMALGRYGARPVILTAGTRTFEGDAIAVVIANGQYFGGGLNIAPRATVMDGVFDVQVFSGPRRMAFSVMPRVITGSHLSHASVRRFVASSISLRCEQGWPVECDGEVIGSGQVEATVVPHAIDFKI
jgi:diacylglycerol kinase (ATP)